MLAIFAGCLSACSDLPQSIESLPPVQHPPAAARHVVFTDTSLESNIRIEPSHVERDATGLLDVQLNFRSITESDLYLDVFITFIKDGQFVEKQGPKRVTLGGNLHDALFFSSSQPADDYKITFDFAK
jgi:hypothetical protein